MRADIAMRRGRYADAVHWLEVCRDIMRSMPGIVPMDSLCWLVLALAADGRFDDAARALDEARAMPDLERWFGRPLLIEAGEALLAKDPIAYDDVMVRSSDCMPMDTALARILGAEIFESDSNGAPVRWLRQALDTYEAAGATLEADRTRRLLRQAGGVVPRRRRAKGHVPVALAPFGVTAREVDVLRLVGEGLSNAAIGERLYLSVRTVEAHVSSLLVKLGAESRGQLTARTASIDLDT
jgi:DNA-binding NarL/FixJ family response regulator